MDDLVKRLRGTPIYEGHGEESDLPDQAADRIEALEAQVRAADALAKIAQRTLDGYGFTADGNDTWREVSAVDLQDMEEALAAYRATKEGGA